MYGRASQLIYDEPISAQKAALLKLCTLSDMDVRVRGHVTCFSKVCVVGTVPRPCQTQPLKILTFKLFKFISSSVIF